MVSINKNYHIFFPYAVKTVGMFENRFDLINRYMKKKSLNRNFFFRENLPNIKEIYEYFSLIKKNSYSKKYFGKLLTNDDSWKFIGALADLDNFSKSINYIIKNNISKAYLMTNTAGHHADNQHYELFCPINQLFFIIELLNRIDFFPNISWIDIDAHFGNGDKKLFDEYITREKNINGICFHNDFQDIKEKNYLGIKYSRDITERNFLKLLKDKIKINLETQYLLVFFGTDIFSNDYGDNRNICLRILSPLISLFEEKISKTKTKLIIIQAGGSKAENISALIDIF